MTRARSAAAALALLALAQTAPAFAQTVAGTAFEDRDGDGVRDAGEPAVPDVAVTLVGTRDAGGAFAQTLATSASGAYSFAPANGCYVVAPQDPPGWRLSVSRRSLAAEGSPGYAFPVGLPRFAKLDQGIPNLFSGSFRYTAMGDSIAYNFNVCSYPESFWYAKRIRDRLACAVPATTFTLDQAAVKGQHTDDLLVDDTADMNNVFRVIEAQPDLVTISMIGNDLLDVDPAGTPTQAQINTAVAEVLDSRRNLQEALAAITSEVPGADIVLNTLYDNLTYNCNTGNTSPFHAAWLPIVNRILADVAWGQARRASVLDAAADVAQEDLAGVCTGYDALICRDLFGFDRIHPNNDGYSLLREKGWEAVGGVNLGPKDVLGRTAQAADWGYLRRVRHLLPASAEVRAGAAATSPENAFRDDDGGASASVTLGIGSEEFRVGGFPDWFDEDVAVKAIAGVRYRTTGTVTDDFYRMEASLSSEFAAPPGHAFTPTDWNFVTPIVGGGGPNAPAEHPDYPNARLLALPNVAAFRTVTATLSTNPTPAPGGAGYDWPAPTAADLATTALRLVAAPAAQTAGNDSYTIELDAAWIDLYGWQKPRPAEVGGLRAARLADGTIDLTFDSVAGAARYNVYSGRLATLAGSGYDHGDGAPEGPACDAATAAAGGGRLKISLAAANQAAESVYFLVTAHADDVESPAGFRSDGSEVDRKESTCR